jgi:hypothetical protein
VTQDVAKTAARPSGRIIMKTRPVHKLSLTKTTLRTLGGRDLGRVGGGTGVDILIATESCDGRLALPPTEHCLRR